MLASLDALALMLFVVTGLRSHAEGSVLAPFLRNAVPLLVAWFAVALPLGAYRRPGAGTLLRTWVVAVPVALTVRSVWVGSPTGGRFVVFLGIGLAFTLLYLAAGRGLAVLISGHEDSQRRRP